MIDLSDLKIGDKVVMSGRLINDTVKKIDKITPTGLIKIGTSFFYKNGSERCSDTWNSSRIRPCTPEDEENIKKKIFCSKVLKKINDMKSISYKNALKINKIFGGE